MLADYFGGLLFGVSACAMAIAATIAYKRFKPFEAFAYSVGCLLFLGLVTAFMTDFIPKQQTTDAAYKNALTAIQRLKVEVEEANTLAAKQQEQIGDLEAQLQRINASELPKGQVTQAPDLLTTRLYRDQTPGYFLLTRLRDGQVRLPEAGEVYSVALLDKGTGRRLSFQRRLYTFGDREGALIASLQVLKANFIDKLSEVFDVAIFIRGSADTADYTGPFHPDYEFKTIELYRLQPSGQYKNELEEIRLSEVTNQDLPNLRARYVFEQWKRISPAMPAKILEAFPKSSTVLISFDIYLLLRWR